MSQDSLHERGKALEDLFFKNKDAQLLENLRQQARQQDAKDLLGSVSGVTDDTVLTELVAHNINAETLASLAIVPLVAVAWADDKMENREREAIMKATAENGIDSDSPGYAIIKSWLKERPGDDLLVTWIDYVGFLSEVLDAVAYGQLKTTVIGRAKNVAQSAGGILGLSKVSDVEQEVLDRLAAAFK